jgi:hypothetical protein
MGVLISAGTMGYWIVKGKIAAIYLSQEKECVIFQIQISHLLAVQR